MFTGIVAGTYLVQSISGSKQFKTLTLRVPYSFTPRLKLGASIAVNGVCLTVTEIQKKTEEESLLSFDIIEETLRLTGLKRIKEGDMVNLERSLTYGEEVGGHLVTGHVSTEAKIHQVQEKSNNVVFTFEIPKKWQAYLVPKTHIAIDGISLTLVSHLEDRGKVYFTSHLIPETLKLTTLGFKGEGEWVNIEFNQTIKTIVETLRSYEEREGQNLSRLISKS